MNLRDYQAWVVGDACELFQKPESGLIVAATGLGKTILFSEIVNRLCDHPWKRALVLAHREELVHQAADKIHRITGHRPDIEMASDHAEIGLMKSRVVVASKDSIAHRLAKYRPNEFHLLVIDEAHHAVARRYRTIIDHFRDRNPDIRVLGVTATPDRADERKLGKVFGNVIADLNVLFGVKNGWLVDIHAKPVFIDSVDLSVCRKSKGDFNVEDLDRALTHMKPVWGMADAACNLLGDKKTLFFCVTIAHAEMMTNVLNRMKPGTAEMVTGKTPKDQRQEVLRRFRDGTTRRLVNVGVFTEGFDEPSIEAIAMCRPTMSRALYAQMLGRGTRVLPGVIEHATSIEERLDLIAESAKPRLEVLDFVGNSAKHKLVTAIDILGDGADDEVLEIARELAAERDQPTLEVIEEAKKTAAEREAERIAKQREKLRQIRGKTTYTVGKAVDPFAVMDIKPARVPGWHQGKPATEAQIATLKKFGIEPPKDIGLSHASQLIDEAISRARNGKPSFKQAKILKRFGFNASEMTFEQASSAIGRLAANGWKRVG